VVLAREFSISDSANPFYLKLRNSIPLAVLGHPARPPQLLSLSPERDTKEFALATSLPRWILPFRSPDLSSSRPFSSFARPDVFIFSSNSGSSKDGAGRGLGVGVGGGREREKRRDRRRPRPVRIFRCCDIGQQKLKSLPCTRTRAREITAARLSRETSRRGNTPRPGVGTG